MPTNKTITINGRVYDAVTGLPINKPVYDAVDRRSPAAKPAPKAEAAPEVKAEPKPAPKAEKKEKPAIERSTPTAATAVHSTTQRSQTLLRRITKKPVPSAAKRPSGGRNMDIARSSKISKFAPHPIAKTPVQKVTAQPAAKPDKAPQVHPLAARALSRRAVTKPIAAKPATTKEIKDAAIATALAAPKPKPAKKSKKKNKWVRRLIIIGSIVLAIGLILFAVYRFIPSVSVGIAATQAGVNASYPEYVPDGYALSHPVTYSDGEVALKFQSNSNDNSYTITQTRSSWDSSAVLDNVVKPAAGDNYITTKERGLTVYSYNNNAAWVNAGVLYVISSDNAPLSGEQIRHIATSL